MQKRRIMTIIVISSILLIAVFWKTLSTKFKAIALSLGLCLSCTKADVVKYATGSTDSLKLATGNYQLPTDNPNNNSGGNNSGGNNTGSNTVTLGQATFDFNDNASGPKVLVYLPSHSVVARPGVGIAGNANSFVEYFLINQYGQTVVHCYNTVSGLHPNYTNAFNGNNHTEPYNKMLTVGTYHLVARNISVESGVKQSWTFGNVQGGNGNNMLNTVMVSGETLEATFTLTELPSGYAYKLNCNSLLN